MRYLDVNVTITTTFGPSTWVTIGKEHVIPGGNSHNVNVSYTTYLIEENHLKDLLSRNTKRVDLTAYTKQEDYYFPRDDCLDQILSIYRGEVNESRGRRLESDQLIICTRREKSVLIPRY